MHQRSDDPFYWGLIIKFDCSCKLRYVVTYGTALAHGDVTVDAMSQVYLDKKVTNSDITSIKKTLGEEWKIYVVAEGTQAAGFENAYEALNESFGTPGADGYVAPNFLANAEGSTWIETDGQPTE